MAKRAALANPQSLKRTGFQNFLVQFKKNWQLHLMILAPLVYMIIFHYVPMYGLQMAFRDFTPRAGVWNSEWVGLGQFITFFEYYRWHNIITNTLILSLYTILVGEDRRRRVRRRPFRG